MAMLNIAKPRVRPSSTWIAALPDELRHRRSQYDYDESDFEIASHGAQGRSEMFLGDVPHFVTPRCLPTPMIVSRQGC
jgi:hypothetical protein